MLEGLSHLVVSTAASKPQAAHLPAAFTPFELALMKYLAIGSPQGQIPDMLLS